VLYPAELRGLVHEKDTASEPGGPFDGLGGSGSKLSSIPEYSA